MADGASGSGGGAREPQTQQEVLQVFQAMRNEIGQMGEKINELDNEMSEHELVLAALEPMDKSRKCFRLIGSVLVERTVAEVMPAVNNNKEQLAQVIAKLEEQRELKNTELSAFQTKYKIRVKGEDEPEATDKPEAPSQGVLV
mmetsp:Transcript_7056/g.18418  ORF Transcript_7056/g.18418 Transcript_7056/m.18418 type:complete len:143 (+) Transcript_7056:153-581(+)|eukprot:jgi/Tetstr1/432771/TSEL_002332.t1